MPDSQVEEIKSKVDIVQIIGERVQLKKSGRNLKGLCPFHGEKTPSFFVTPDIQIFKCFGCGASGDVFNFLMQYEGLTFPEALEQLAERAGVVLKKREQTSSEVKSQRIYELMHLASEYYHYLLTEHKVGKKALAYLKDRGISNQSIDDFKLGYALDSWDGLQQFLIKKKGFTSEELEAAGLIIRATNHGPRTTDYYYDRFRSRIMFPLTTYAGKIVGFSGRTLEADAKEAKYINSPETEYYHKSELLFGVHMAKKAIRDKDRIVVVEGEFDVISSHQIGLKEVVAIKGSALTDEQASLIRRLTHNVILALDGDAAGQEAIKRGIGVCEKQALSLRVVAITGGKDPDELAKKNPNLWKDQLQQAESVYSYLINSAVKQFDPQSGQGKKLITQAVMPELIKIEHAVEREFYLKKLSDALHVSESALQEEYSKTKRAIQIGKSPTEIEDKTQNMSRREVLERQLIGLVLQHPHPQQACQACQSDWFAEPHLKRLYEQISDAVGENDISSKGIINKLSEAVRPLAEDIYTMKVSWLEESTDSLNELLTETKKKLQEVWRKQRLVDLSKAMTQAADNPQELHDIQREYHQLADASS
jgi:DNA primase